MIPTVAALWLWGALATPSAATPAAAHDACQGRFDWASVPAARWHRLPTQGAPPRKALHGTLVVDPERQIVLVFGADTHHEDYDNSVHRLELRTLCWSRDYPADPVSDYVVTEDGYPVTRSGRPWAMHTFDTVDWEPVNGTLLAVGFPAHAYMVFESRGLDPRRLSRPVWSYDPDARRWQLHRAPRTPYLFARAMTWDPDRRIMIAHDGHATWHFDPAAGGWTRHEASGPRGWHLKMVYDTTRRRALAYGRNGGDDTLWAYDPDRRAWQVLETRRTAPRGEGAALVYDPKNAVILFLAPDGPDTYANPSGRAQTWVRHADSPDWARLETPSPPLYGINFHMDYDPVRGVVLYGERDAGGRLALWAFRYR